VCGGQPYVNPHEQRWLLAGGVLGLCPIHVGKKVSRKEPCRQKVTYSILSQPEDHNEWLRVLGKLGASQLSVT
jgi:hypothetical protein